MKVTAIIPAAGSGKRINQKKQFTKLLGRAMLEITVNEFETCQAIDDIIVAAPKEDLEITAELLKTFKKVKKIIAGGEERQNSVYLGLKAASNDTDIIVIHDAARPLITKELIAAAISEAKASKAVIVGVPVKDTIKTVSPENTVMETLDRSTLWQIQTPQVFHYSVIMEAYNRADKVGYVATDDSKLVERLGISVKIIKGSYENIKVTTSEDILIAEALLNGRGVI